MTAMVERSVLRTGESVRVLVVDDEPALAELLAMALSLEGWEIRIASDGLTAVHAVRDFQPDVVVLDVMLPDIDGVEVLRRIRVDVPDLPVLFVSAKDSAEIRTAGDDYLAKPFSLAEVVLRLRTLLRRLRLDAASPGPSLVIGDLILDEDNHEVTRGGRRIDLTTLEFEVLRFLMRNAGRVLTSAQILDQVWHYDFGSQANVVSLYISYLRQKIDGHTPMIHFIPGEGYVLRPGS